MRSLAGNPKHEARNPKQAPKRKTRNVEMACARMARVPFRHFFFGVLDLFRVSCFGFRASPHWRWMLNIKQTWPVPGVSVDRIFRRPYTAFMSDYERQIKAGRIVPGM